MAIFVKLDSWAVGGPPVWVNIDSVREVTSHAASVTIIGVGNNAYASAVNLSTFMSALSTAGVSLINDVYYPRS